MGAGVKRGRPATGHVPLTARLSPEERERVLAWGPGPSEAVRRLLAVAEATRTDEGDPRAALAALARSLGLDVIER